MPHRRWILVLVLFMLFTASNVFAQQRRINVDSLKKSIALKRDSLIKYNQDRTALLQMEQKRTKDSMMRARMHITDSIQTIRENRLDSLNQIKKYRNSRHYRDSIARIKKNFQDSLKSVRLHIMDSIKMNRLAFKDSLTKRQEFIKDSINSSISKRKDSLQNAISEKKRNNSKSDSLSKNNEKNPETDPDKNLTKEEKRQKAIKKKHNDKQEAYNNSVFLKKRWSFPRNALQNTYTRYNYYYNADMKFQRMLTRVYSLQKINYDTIIDVYRISPKNSVKYGGSDPDSIIKKASLDIQMHDPRSKWQDNLYYLIAQSYFYKDDFDNAIPYLKYIIANYKEDLDKKGRSKRNNIEKITSKDGKSERVLTICTKEPTGIWRYIKHMPIRNDALMLLARSYADDGYYTEAQTLLNQMAVDVNFPKRLNRDLYQLKTKIYLSEMNYPAASQSLNLALNSSKSKKNKSRLYFLKGQLYEMNNQNDSAYQEFHQIIGGTPDMDIEIASIKNMVELTYENNMTGNVKYLTQKVKKMTREDKYSPYWPSLKFYLGMLSLEENDVASAEKYFNESIANNTDPLSKSQALSELILFYFSEGNYVKSNQFLSQLKEISPEYDLHLDGSEYIPKLAEYQSSWFHNDSMIYLSNLTEKEQIKWAENMQKLNDEKLEKSNNGFKELTPQGGTKSTSNFYFANPVNVDKGKKEFSKIWGKDVLNIDNWSISSLTTNAVKGDQSTNATTSTINESVEEGKPYAKYLAEIPKTESEKSNMNLEIQKSMYNLGVMHFQQLDMPLKSVYYFDTLLTRYPASTYRPKILFDEFLIFQKLGDTVMANNYKLILEKEYPGTYTDIFQEFTNSQNAKERKDTASAVYQSMYALFENDEYANVLKFDSMNRYLLKSNNDYEIKANLLDIQSLAGLGKFQNAYDLVLTTENMPLDTDEKDFLANLKTALKQKLNLNQSDSLNIIDSTSTKIDSTVFVLDPNAKCQLAFILPNPEMVTSVKISFSDYLIKYYSMMNYKCSEKYLNGNKAVIFIYQFKNKSDADQFYQLIGERWATEIKSVPFNANSFFIINTDKLYYLYDEKGVDNYLKYYKENF